MPSWLARPATLMKNIFRQAFPDWEQRALQEGENILKSALEDVQSGVWEWRAKGNCIHYSSRWMTMLGYEPYDLGASLSDWKQLIHPDEQVKIYSAFEMLLIAKNDINVSEYRIRHKDGAYRWVLEIAKALIKNGKTVRVLVLQTDISRQKQAEESLRESEEKYRILLEKSSDPIFSFHPDHTFQYANRALARLVHMEDESIAGMPLERIFPADEAPKILTAIRETFENGHHKVIEMWLPSPEGNRYYLTSLEPVKSGDGRVLSVMCAAKDITERKKAEEKLLKSRELTSKIFQNFPVAVYMRDYKKGGRYVMVNKMWDDLHQNSPMLSAVLSEFEDAALSTGSAVTFEHTVPTKDNQMKTMKSNLIPLYDENGQLEYLLGMAEDISDIKKLEADLLAKDVALAQASTEKAIAALVAGLSHDINNALSGITGGKDLVKLYLSKTEQTLVNINDEHAALAEPILNIQNKMRRSLSRTGDNGALERLITFLNEGLPNHIAELTTNMDSALRYLSYVDNGQLIIRDVTSGIRDYVKQDHALGSFEIRPAIRGAVSLSKGQYKPMAQDQTKTVSVDICDASPSVTVFGNAGEFMGVIVNLINNAVAEFPRGSSNTICISWEKGHNPALEDIVRIYVSNDGPPLQEHLLGRIFNERLRSTHGGSGIGLLAVKSTLDRFGATIRHTTEFIPPEKTGQPATPANRAKTWTTFEMELLVSEAQTGGYRRPSGHPIPPRRLLVVDDEQYMLDIMEKYAENLGHTAVLFNDPKDAMTWYAGHSDEVDVIITDQCMPNMNGCQLISNMKQYASNKTFMIMTGHGALTLSREDTKDVHLLVRKPFDQRQLNFAIEDAVDEREKADGIKIV